MNQRKPIRLSPSIRNGILEKQKSRCYWCKKIFGHYVVDSQGIIHEVKIRWDHYIPYVITQSNSNGEFVASCQFCNGWKHSKLPLNEKELRHYLLKKWKNSKYEYDDAILGWKMEVDERFIQFMGNEFEQGELFDKGELQDIIYEKT